MRVANYKLDGYFSRFEEVENYNGTIRARWVAGRNEMPVYEVWHWSTLIASYDAINGVFLARPDFISQTTATLLGKVLRAMPREHVEAWIALELNSTRRIDGKRARQLRKQLW